MGESEKRGWRGLVGRAVQDARRSTAELRARLEELRDRALDEVVSRIADRPVRTTPDQLFRKKKRIEGGASGRGDARRDAGAAPKSARSEGGAPALETRSEPPRRKPPSPRGPVTEDAPAPGVARGGEATPARSDEREAGAEAGARRDGSEAGARSDGREAGAEAKARRDGGEAGEEAGARSGRREAGEEARARSDGREELARSDGREAPARSDGREAPARSDGREAGDETPAPGKKRRRRRGGGRSKSRTKAPALHLLPRGASQVFASWSLADGYARALAEGERVELRIFDGDERVARVGVAEPKGEAFVAVPRDDRGYVAELVIGGRAVERTAEARVPPRRASRSSGMPRFVRLPPAAEPGPAPEPVAPDWWPVQGWPVPGPGPSVWSASWPRPPRFREGEGRFPGASEGWLLGASEGWVPGASEGWAPGASEGWAPGASEGWAPGASEGGAPGAAAPSSGGGVEHARPEARLPPRYRWETSRLAGDEVPSSAGAPQGWWSTAERPSSERIARYLVESSEAPPRGGFGPPPSYVPGEAEPGGSADGRGREGGAPERASSAGRAASVGAWAPAVSGADSAPDAAAEAFRGEAPEGGASRAGREPRGGDPDLRRAPVETEPSDVLAPRPIGRRPKRGPDRPALFPKPLAEAERAPRKLRALRTLARSETWERPLLYAEHEGPRPRRLGEEWGSPRARSAPISDERLLYRRVPAERREARRSPSERRLLERPLEPDDEE